MYAYFISIVSANREIEGIKGCNTTLKLVNGMEKPFRYNLGLLFAYRALRNKSVSIRAKRNVNNFHLNKNVMPGNVEGKSVTLLYTLG